MATAITPKILGPDGVLREDLSFSTTLVSRFFTGTVDASTVEVEVSIRGEAYTSDPDLVLFDGTDWMVPNPAAYPDGLDLVSGVNEIQIRAVTGSGSRSSPASLSVRLVRQGDLGVVGTIPSGISVEQLDQSVKISVVGVDETHFRGVNVYASVFAGGGTTGYTRLNIDTVTTATRTESTAAVGSLETEADVPLNPDGTVAADPLYMRFVGTEVDKDGALVQADFDEQLEVPESTRRLRTTLSLESVTTVDLYTFEHSRTAGPNSDPATVFVGAFAALQSDTPLYYVLTGVYYDPDALVEFESAFSAEVVANPLRISVNVGTFPVVARQQIVREVITSIQRSNPQVRVEPGAVLRDTFIDPFASESERLRFILDFLHRSQSFAALLAVDDPANTGSSTSVASSTYKQALKKAFGLVKDSDVQALIDRAFESLASNFGIFRRAGRYARGEVTFFTTTRPDRTVPIPLGASVGAGSLEYRVTQGTSIPLDNQARYYDPISGRYRVTVSVQASVVGSKGNVGAGQIRRVLSGVSGMSVVNAGAMFGGTDGETNAQLAARARNALASVDSGTKRGYLQTAADVPGVIRANVVAAGDALMERDLDVEGVHRGGKVDVWVQGDNLSTVTDVFAFAFDIARDVHFVVVGDPIDLIFRAVDPQLSSSLPILEMLDDPSVGFAFRNATTGEAFDLTDVTLLGYDLIQLSSAVAQPSVTLTDVVLGDYRRRTGNTFVLTRQPVRDVSSVVGTASGTLPAEAWSLVHPGDPLVEGRSTLAGDYIAITPISDGSGGFIPDGGSIPVADEPHVLVAEYQEYLDSLGADPLSIVVTSADGLTTYRGPDDPSGFSDYTVVDGDATTAVSIRRIPTGNIASGATVLVSYAHQENFVVTYRTNVIIGVAQAAIEATRHVTADVLVKEAIEVPVDISATVTLVQSADQATVDTAIRTNLANYFAGLTLGTPVRQSDIVGIIEQTPKVSFVAVPLTKLVRGTGSQVTREVLGTGQVGDTTYLPAWSSPTVSVWLVEQELAAATTDGGGPTTEFRGVFQDDIALYLVEASPGTSLRIAAGRAYIVGSDGVSIPGFSDDATLIAAGYTTQDEIAARRIALTGDRVLLSTSVDDSPVNHSYAATYIVGVDSGAKNLEPGDTDVLTLGKVEFTFDEDH